MGFSVNLDNYPKMLLYFNMHINNILGTLNVTFLCRNYIFIGKKTQTSIKNKTLILNFASVQNSLSKALLLTKYSLSKKGNSTFPQSKKHLSYISNATSILLLCSKELM